jgi:hypothetical protein
LVAFHFFVLNTGSVFIQKRAVIVVSVKLSGADSRVSWALMGEQRKERSTSLPNNELAIQVRPVNQGWANLDQASKHLEVFRFRDLSPTPKP